jgi:hypothetical protein
MLPYYYNEIMVTLDYRDVKGGFLWRPHPLYPPLLIKERGKLFF